MKMEKKLYYVVEKELTRVGDIEETTGMKDIVVYEIIDNKPKRLFSLDCPNENNSEKEIKNYLDDNGYGDEEFELILL